MSPSNIFKDRYGFWFWLRWIVWFAGSFIAAAAAWTILFKFFFGKITGPELEITWSVTVFGSWFLLVVPFMRKKEQIWKRLNDDQEKAVDLWLRAMALFIGTLAATCFLWTLSSRSEIVEPGLQTRWAKKVFGTCLAVLVPFLIYFYRKADALFSRAHARQTYSPRYRSLRVPIEKRTLPGTLSEALKKIPETLPNSHVADARLKDGREILDIFIKFRREIAGVYARETFDFEASDIVELKAADPGRWPVSEESGWLRVDVDG